MVPGNGPQPAFGMIVGEAPGRKEVEIGLPFCGQAGRLLETVLKAVGIDRREVYITNVVKELPLDSDGKIRRPTPDEVKEWSPILAGEIESVSPAAILALGRTAVNALTLIEPDLVPFGSKIGMVYTAWHPAFVLRKRGVQDEWLEQIRPWAEALARSTY